MSTCFSPLYNLASATRLLLWYKEERANIRKDSTDGAFENEKRKSVRRRPVFETGNSSLRYNCAVGNFQQTRAAKWAAQTLVVEMASEFWQSEWSWKDLAGHKNYGGLGNIATNHSLWTNTINHLPCVPPKERLRSESTDVLGKSAAKTKLEVV